MDDFLQPLLEQKPSAILKVQAAWDGLGIESQMRLLSALDKANGYLPPDVARKALWSANAYVRFLAGKRIRHQDDPGLAEAAAKDANQLVRSTQVRAGLFERHRSDFPAKFWALPSASQFAYLAEVEDYFGPEPKDLVSLLDFALAHDIPEETITDVAVEYVETVRTVKKRHLYHLYVLPLWQFLPRSPIGLARYLIRRLPDPGWLSQDLIRELLKREDEHFFFAFLDRTERSLRPLRKAILRSTVLHLDADSKAEIASGNRLRLQLTDWYRLSPLIYIACLFLLSTADLKVIAFVAAAAGVAILLRSFKPGQPAYPSRLAVEKAGG